MSAPGWTRRTTIIWVVEDPVPRCEDVGDAHVVSTAYAASLAQSDSLPRKMRELRARGATVKTAEDASDSTKAWARKLRGALAAMSPGRLADVAADLELPALATALRAWPPAQPMTFKNLATVCMNNDGPAPELTRSARLLLALEHL